MIQAQSFHSPYGYRYIRDGGKVPAVLHACKESRAEFLDTGAKEETGKGKKDGGLTRRQREHPVYKLSFYARSARTSRPVYFSASHDSLWGDAKIDTFHQGRINVVTSLDIAPTLTHLIWEPFTAVDLRDLLAKFPRLETLTILVRNYMIPILRPELDGQLDDRGYSTEQLRLINNEVNQRTANTQLLAVMESEKTEMKMPVLKYRFRSQFLTNEGLALPIRPEDPLSEFDQGMIEQVEDRSDRSY